MLFKFPFYFQYDSMQCGIACLQMICKHFGKKYTIADLSKICSVSAQGVSLHAINNAAQTLGFRTVSIKIDCATLARTPLPCILHWKQNHFVVLYKVRKKHIFYIADPSRGLLKYKIEDFKKHWINSKYEGKGIAMFFEPTPKFYSYETQTIENEKNFVHSLFHSVQKHQKDYGKLALTLLIISLLQIAFPFFTQSIVDVGIRNRDIKFILLVLMGQMLLTIGRAANDFAHRWILLKTSHHIGITLISAFFTKLLNLPMSFFDTKLMGDLMQRMSDYKRVSNFMTQHLLNLAYAMISFIVFSIILYFYSHVIFIVFFLSCLIHASWIALFFKKRKALDYELFEQQAINNNKTYDILNCMQEIKLQNCEQRRKNDWERTQNSLLSVQSRTLKVHQIQEIGCTLINEIKNICITIIAAMAVIKGDMTLGMMLATQYIVGQLRSPIERLLSFAYSLQDVKISMERINEIQTISDEDANIECLKNIDSNYEGILLKQVHFKYCSHESGDTLHNINIHIPHGKVTAIVGASGSGKTTLLRLILGYYAASNGSICIGKTNIQKLNKKWWHRQCGVVMQDGAIFSDTIARNIATNDKCIDYKRLLKAAQMACIVDFVMSLPLQFNTKVGRDGVQLSQGQKQRILIARAVYKNPRYIFLDEATNSLDADNEKK